MVGILSVLTENLRWRFRSSDACISDVQHQLHASLELPETLMDFERYCSFHAPVIVVFSVQESERFLWNTRHAGKRGPCLIIYRLHPNRTLPAPDTFPQTCSASHLMNIHLDVRLNLVRTCLRYLNSLERPPNTLKPTHPIFRLHLNLKITFLLPHGW